jgi:RNA polymerase sigma factor (sigma-70 family)
MMQDDIRLLREFAERDSQEAFAAIVSRYVNLVYSTAFRQVHDFHLAQEVTQAVFIILAQKAGSLNCKTILSGWLCRTARNASANALTIQRRRQEREKQYMETTPSQSNETETEHWGQIEPHLDAAMNQLGRADHDAVVMRFFESKSFKDVSAALGTSEAGAKMRLSRALEKMRKFFSKRGIIISATAIAGAVASNSLQAAPVGLAGSVTVAAMKGTTVTGSTLTIIKSTLKVMAYSKLKIIVGVGAVVLTIAAGSDVVVQVMKAGNDDAKPASTSSIPAFSGFETPEAAMKSFIWSESTGNPDKLLAACTPEQGERFKKKLAEVPAGEMKKKMAQEARNRANYEIAEKQIISETEVRLLLRVQPYPGHPKVGNDLQVMQKIGSDWKYAGKYGVDIKIQEP